MGNETGVTAVVREIYGKYLDEVTRKEAARKPGEGLFGRRGGAKDDPCHQIFAEKVETALKDAAEAGLSPAEAGALLEYVYFAPIEEHPARSAYWMLLAIHGLTLPLIDALTAEDAAALAARYEEGYPRRERLPAQERALEKLRERAGEETRRSRRLFKR